MSARLRRLVLNASSTANGWICGRELQTFERRERGQRLGHARQHFVVKRVELNRRCARVVHDQLAEDVLSLAIPLFIAERFACFELRPSSIVNAVDNRKIKGIEHAGM